MADIKFSVEKCEDSKSKFAKIQENNQSKLSALKIVDHLFPIKQASGTQTFSVVERESESENEIIFHDPDLRPYKKITLLSIVSTLYRYSGNVKSVEIMLNLSIYTKGTALKPLSNAHIVQLEIFFLNFSH